ATRMREGKCARWCAPGLGKPRSTPNKARFVKSHAQGGAPGGPWARLLDLHNSAADQVMRRRENRLLRRPHGPSEAFHRMATVAPAHISKLGNKLLEFGPHQGEQLEQPVGHLPCRNPPCLVAKIGAQEVRDVDHLEKWSRADKSIAADPGRGQRAIVKISHVANI